MAAGTGLVGKSNIQLDIKYKNALDLSLPSSNLIINTGINWAYGIGENQCNVLHHDSRSIDATGETLDLSTGAWTAGTAKDIFGNVLTMTFLKLLYLKNTHATLILEVFGNTSNDLGIMESTADALLIQPGGSFLWQCPTAAGIECTADKNLFIASVAGTITYDIVLMGLD